MQPIENTDLVSDGSFWLSQPPQRGGACLAPYRQVRRRRTFGVSGSNRRLLRYGHHRSGDSDVEPYMDIFHIDKGLLKGVDVEIWDATKLGACARSEGAGELTRASMYSGELRRLVFRGIRFSECSFARAKFVEVTFRRCKLRKLTLHGRCFGIVTSPIASSKIVILTTVRSCGRLLILRLSNLAMARRIGNRALILFANLKLGFEKAGNGRLASTSSPASSERSKLAKNSSVYGVGAARLQLLFGTL